VAAIQPARFGSTKKRVPIRLAQDFQNFMLSRIVSDHLDLRFDLRKLRELVRAGLLTGFEFEPIPEPWPNAGEKT
jgi:hypothetical protein